MCFPLQSSGLVSQLISHCCFPALTALRLRHEGVLATLSARSAVTDAAPTDADADPQPGELQAAALQLAAANAALVVSGVAAEQCIEQARVQGTGPTSAGSASREAAFELLLDLICQDSDCWHAAQVSVRALHAPIALARASAAICDGGMIRPSACAALPGAAWLRGSLGQLRLPRLLSLPLCRRTPLPLLLQEQLSTVVHSAASDVLPLTFGNTPLQNLRGPE